MKRTFQMIVVMLVLGFCTNAFAVITTASDNEASPGESIELTDGTNTLLLNFSPSVIGRYISDSAGTAGNIQWFAGSTYHVGGTTIYASSSDATSLYKQDRIATNVFGDFTFPTQPEAIAADGTKTPAEDVWLGASWEK
ncbi:MAG: hypothetical protein RQ754_11160 [Desulfuromonadales bacterium]|nr:hypothetical protein [Desulfuromonadales bacterium]